MTEDQKEKLEQLVNRTFYLLPEDEPDIREVIVSSVDAELDKESALLMLTRVDGTDSYTFPIYDVHEVELLNDEDAYVWRADAELACDFSPLYQRLQHHRDVVELNKLWADKVDMYLLSPSTYEVICPVVIHATKPTIKPAAGMTISFRIECASEHGEELYNKPPFQTLGDGGSFFVPYEELQPFVRGETKYYTNVEGKMFLVATDKHFIAHGIKRRINDLRVFADQTFWRI